MSASNPKKGSRRSIIKQRIEWNGEKGHFKFYDKEQGQDVIIQKVVGIVLDPDVATITGYSDTLQAGLFSNYFSAQGDRIVVRNSATKRIVAGGEGMWSDIKSTIKGLGGKYTKAIFLFNPREDKVFVLQLSGSAFQEYLEFEKTVKGGSAGVVLKTLVAERNPMGQKAKGGIKYFTPAFAISEVQSDENKKKAVAKDEELQAWLSDSGVYEESDETDVPISGAADSAHNMLSHHDWEPTVPPPPIPPVDDLPF